MSVRRWRKSRDKRKIRSDHLYAKQKIISRKKSQKTVKNEQDHICMSHLNGRKYCWHQLTMSMFTLN